jgi:hypothetical protein
MPRRRLIVFLLFLVLSGCAWTEKFFGTILHVSAEEKFAEERQSELMPLAPPLGPSRRIVQQLTALWPGRQETLLCVLELDSRRIAMAGLTNDGLSLFDLSYDGKTLQSRKSPLLPDTVAPEYIIADLQLVYWPAAALQKMLPKYWRLETDGNHRRLYFNEEPRVDVHYLAPDATWPKDVELINHRFNYHLQIKTISYEALSE